MERIRFKTFFTEKEFWLLILLGVLYFYRPLFLGETFFFRDLTYDFIPQKQLFAHFLKQGELPLWDIFRHGGQPYFADPNNSVFHPSNLLYLVLPFFTAFNLTIVSHALLYLIGTYLFCRILGFSQLGSLTAAATYGFCGYSLSLINLFGRFLALSYLPFLFLFWHLALQETQRRWYALTVTFGVLQVLCGAPEVNVISMLLLLGWTLFSHLPQIPTTRKIILWIVLGVFIIGISAVQLLPTLEMVQHSSRGTGMDYQEFSSSSLHPKRLPELVVPKFSGTTDLLPYQLYYWGVALTDGDDYPYILNIYFGALPLLLAIWGTFQKDEAKPFLVRRLRLFLLCVFLASLSLSLGRFLPGFRFLYQHLPLMSLFRYPIKFLLVGIFPLALLAAYGFDKFFSVPSSKALRASLWLCAFVSGAIMLLFLLSDSFAQGLLTSLFQQDRNEILRNSFSSSLLQLFALLLAAGLLYQSHCRHPKPWQSLGFVTLLCLDLLTAGSTVNVYAAKEFFIDEPSAAQIVQQHIGDGRLFRTDNPKNIQLYAPSNDVVWGYRWSLETLDGYLGAFWYIPVLFHDNYVGLGNTHLMTLKAVVKSLTWSQKLPLLSVAGITNVLSADARLASLPGLQKVAEIENNSNRKFYLYQNTRAVASVEFITNSRHAESDEQALEFMLRPGYDPRKEVILQTPEASLFRREHGTCETAARIETIRENSHRQDYTVSTNCDGFLLFSEPFYPGWTVKINGQPALQLRANFAFSAVFLSKGEHTVTRPYRPLSLFAGAGISLSFCAALYVFLHFANRKELLDFSPRR
ncbi:MAG: YfhO family protein [bacterium]|nr:YfhO family protein [bacterium]